MAPGTASFSNVPDAAAPRRIAETAARQLALGFRDPRANHGTLTRIEGGRVFDSPLRPHDQED